MSGPTFIVLLPTACGSKQTPSMNAVSSRWHGLAEHSVRWNPCRRSAESRTCHARQRLDGNRATQRHSHADQRNWRLSSEQPGRPFRTYVSRTPMPHQQPCQPPTANKEECQKTAPPETNAQGVPTLCAVWPSCRRSLGVHRWRSHAAYGAETRRSGAACRQCGGNCAGLITRPASSVAPPDHSGVAGATTAEVTLLSANFALGDTFQDRRQPGRPAVRQTVNSLRACRQDLQENLWTTDRDKQLLSELRRASAMALPRCVVSRYATEFRRSHERSPVPGLAEISKGVGRDPELKQRLHLWESRQISDLICKVLGQQSSGPPRRTARGVQPQRDEQRRKRACALTARGSIMRAMKGLVSGAAQGSADCRRNWTTALIPRHSSHQHWNVPRQRGLHGEAGAKQR